MPPGSKLGYERIRTPCTVTLIWVCGRKIIQAGRTGDDLLSSCMVDGDRCAPIGGGTAQARTVEQRVAARSKFDDEGVATRISAVTATALLLQRVLLRKV